MTWAPRARAGARWRVLAVGALARGPLRPLRVGPALVAQAPRLRPRGGLEGRGAVGELPLQGHEARPARVELRVAGLRGHGRRCGAGALLRLAALRGLHSAAALGEGALLDLQGRAGVGELPSAGAVLAPGALRAAKVS